MGTASLLGMSKCVFILVLLVLGIFCSPSSADVTGSAVANDDSTIKFPKTITLSYEIVSSIKDKANPKPSPLCTVLYDPRTLRYKLSSWTPPSATTDEVEQSSAPQLIRIILPNGSSTVTSLNTFVTSSNLNHQITLWISSFDAKKGETNQNENSGDVFSASITSSPPTPLSAEEERLRKRIERAKARGKPIPTPQKAKSKAKSKSKSKEEKKNRKGKVEIETETETKAKVSVTIVPVNKPGPTAKLGSRAAPLVDAEGNEVVPPEQQPEKTFFQKYWWVFLAASLLALGSGGGDK